ncbi:hypothetical protein [Pedobacter psychrodurus]|uniref:hypothetical protein n=1 Tax=Pedobacter psychrodurus TaxID=2530456 RepID=UPI0013F15D80|nr:hypothetical protein [Pedobacter psychrodurus]
MSNQFKYIVLKNDYHSGKVFGLALTHNFYLNIQHIQIDSFLLGGYALKTLHWA